MPSIIFGTLDGELVAIDETFVEAWSLTDKVWTPANSSEVARNARVLPEAAAASLAGGTLPNFPSTAFQSLPKVETAGE